ncbi:MAG TPA: galactosyltransferase-related protein [Reyranella sp.]|nr:galactosyltransferase-related protein [Reyranella sp.]
MTFTGFVTDNSVNQHMGVVVPYRDRAAHLAEFLPALQKFLADHPNKAPGRTSVLVVEQQAGGEFNRGKLKNVGYALLCEAIDYVCFHDVDYVPQRADYRDPQRGWVHLASKGAETTLDPRGFTIKHDMSRFTGGAVLFTKDAYEKVNGFSNQYWGWGFEDADLNGRCLVRQIPFARRSGRFKTLPHENEGFAVEGRAVSPSAAHLKNKQQFEARFGVEPAYDPNIAAPENVGRSKMEGDGLSDLEYTIVSRETLIGAKPAFVAEKVVVTL